jgi:hypothetical protein
LAISENFNWTSCLTSKSNWIGNIIYWKFFCPSGIWFGIKILHKSSYNLVNLPDSIIPTNIIIGFFDFFNKIKVQFKRDYIFTWIFLTLFIYRDFVDSVSIIDFLDFFSNIWIWSISLKKKNNKINTLNFIYNLNLLYNIFSTFWKSIKLDKLSPILSQA